MDKLRKMLAFLQDMADVQELRTLPGWKVHQLTGPRKGTWSLHLTANWRLTFRVENQELVEVNYEDTTADHDERLKNPRHPGAFIRTEILEPLELSVTAAAQVLGVSRPTLSSLLNGQADLSGDMALRIEKAFGVLMETLMRMQNSWDIVQTRQREKLITVRRYSHRAV